MNPVRAVERGRQLVTKLMADTCVITRLGKPNVDVATGKETLANVNVYHGCCRISTSLADEFTRESAGASMTSEKLTLQIPIGAAEVRTGDQVLLNASVNPHLVGRKFRIVTIATDTFATAAKFTVEELT
jgi:hypothetical protein